MNKTDPDVGLFKKLPSYVVERSRDITGLPLEDTDAVPAEELKEFITKLIPKTQKDDTVDELRKSFYLGERKARIRPSKVSGNKPLRARGKKRMTAVEKRQCGLLRLKKHNKTFQMFIPIYKMWKEYAEELLNAEHFQCSGWEGHYTDKRTETIQNRLKKIDYYGSLLKVTKSRCSNYVGVEGIVIQETKNTFSVIGQDNKVRVIPKLYSEFSVIINSKIGFTVLGNHLHQRPVDRAKQNFKKHCLWI